MGSFVKGVSIGMLVPSHKKNDRPYLFSIIFAPLFYGGCSSVWLERQIVALKAGGSNPLILPPIPLRRVFF